MTIFYFLLSQMMKLWLIQLICTTCFQPLEKQALQRPLRCRKQSCSHRCRLSQVLVFISDFCLIDVLTCVSTMSEAVRHCVSTRLLQCIGMQLFLMSKRLTVSRSHKNFVISRTVWEFYVDKQTDIPTDRDYWKHTTSLRCQCACGKRVKMPLQTDTFTFTSLPSAIELSKNANFPFSFVSHFFQFSVISNCL